MAARISSSARCIWVVFHAIRIFESNVSADETAEWAATINLAVALTQDFCYPVVVVASCILLPARGLAGATYDEAAQYDNTTGID
ncbi:hypothetical protein [Paraburkholderia sacchari]|uniref:hypothetical protein n=1 Tax=Paraburkholderia sacchari TaxID=159450 RepID=UPI003D9654C6